jgi:hypothetical protein
MPAGRQLSLVHSAAATSRLAVHSSIAKPRLERTTHRPHAWLVKDVCLYRPLAAPASPRG